MVAWCLRWGACNTKEREGIFRRDDGNDYILIVVVVTCVIIISKLVTLTLQMGICYFM